MSSIERPQLVKRVRDSNGIWESQAIKLLSEQEILDKFKEPVGKKFPQIRQLLREKGFEIPADWTVGNMEAALIVAYALHQIKKKVGFITMPEFNGSPSVQIQTDPNYFETVSSQVGFLVDFNGIQFEGVLYGPEPIHNKVFPGACSWIGLAKQGLNDPKEHYHNLKSKAMDEVIDALGAIIQNSQST